MHTKYALVGGGHASAAAIEGIRAHDKDGSILLLSRENHRPYSRPLLTKDLWEGSGKIEQVPLHPDEWYAEQHVDVRLRCEVIELDAEGRHLWTERGEEITFDELLLATGCRPRRLRADGAETQGVRYFRDLEDYLDLAARLEHLQHVTLVGGGFTAIELAAALRGRGKEITYMIAEEFPLHRLLPRALGPPLLDYLREMGVETVSGDALAKIAESDGLIHATTYLGNELDTQLVIVDQGGEPLVELGDAAGLAIDDGILVNELGRTSQAHVWAAGDVTEYPCLVLGQIMRVEGADHADHHGRAVGANMAGANEPYAHLPVKWWRVGNLSFAGVGELWARLDTELVWIEPGHEGAVFYVRDEVVRGVLLNVHDRIDWARGLIRDAKPSTAAERASALGVKA